MGNSGFETALGFFGEFSFVGLFERLSESFARIRDLSRQENFVTLEVPHVNRINPKIEFGDVEDEELRCLFFPLIRYDLQLYEKVKSKF